MWAGINLSRKDFEKQPDTGLCSKKVSRLCNLIENYIFRLIFVEIIGVMLLFPIIVLINSIVCISLAFTTFCWMPVVLVLLWVY